MSLQRRLLAAGAALGFSALAPAAHAGPVPFDTFAQFSLNGVGQPAAGCAPADPAANFCAPSSGTPTVALDAPGWRFHLGAAGGLLTVVDVFLGHERFEVFDFGRLLGASSPLAVLTNTTPDCGDDPQQCLATPGISQAVFALGAGDHEITVNQIAGEDLATGYLRIRAFDQNQVPEPGSLALLLTCLGAALLARRHALTGGRP